MFKLLSLYISKVNYFSAGSNNVSSAEVWVTVRYVDYGNQEKVPLSRLRLLDYSFYDLPCQAISCFLAGIEPANPDCAEQTDQRQVMRKVWFEKLLLGNTVEICVVTCNESGQHGIDILVEREDLLRSELLSLFPLPATQLLDHTEQGSVVKLTSFLCSVGIAKRIQNCNAVDAQTIVEEALPAKSNSCFVRSSNVILPVDLSIKNEDSNSSIIGSSHMILPTHNNENAVEVNCDIVPPHSNDVSLVRMDSSTSVISEYFVKPDETDYFGIIPVSNNKLPLQLNRKEDTSASSKSCNESEELNCVNVAPGSSDLLPVCLKIENEEIPPNSECSINNYELISTVAKSEISPVVHLDGENKKVTISSKDNQLEDDYTAQLSPQRSNELIPLFVRLNEKSEISVLVSHVVSANEFYVHPIQEDVAYGISSLSQSLTSHCSDQEKLEQLTIDLNCLNFTGLLCCVQSPDDKKWYRGVIVSSLVCSETCSVQLLDFGDILTVPIRSLYRLETRFCCYPLLAVRCSLLSPECNQSPSKYNQRMCHYLNDAGNDPLIIHIKGKNFLVLLFV